MRKKKIVIGAVSAALLVVCLATWLLSWFAPITIFTPIFLMNTRSELANISENLYIGQGVQVHLSSPLIAQIGTPA